jgi:hypothetical protein
VPIHSAGRIPPESSGFYLFTTAVPFDTVVFTSFQPLNFNPDQEWTQKTISMQTQAH